MQLVLGRALTSRATRPVVLGLRISARGTLSPRRRLFELHSGREARPIPSKDELETVVPPVSDKNRDWHSTSEDLIEALGPIGQEYAKPLGYAQKLDLSHTDAYTAAHNASAAVQEVAANEALLSDEKAAKSTPHRDLKGVLATYILSLGPLVDHLAATGTSIRTSTEFDAALRKVDYPRVIEWLDRYKWDIKDLMNWAWIIQAEDPDLTAMRMATIERYGSERSQGGRAVPPGIYLFVLRRKNFTARGLRLLLIQAWKLMEHASTWPQSKDPSPPAQSSQAETDDFFRKTVPEPKEHRSGLKEDIFIMIIVRLIRHARRVWPAACESITSLFCQYLNGLNFYQRNGHDDARLAFIYNTVLKLLAAPASTQPFISATRQQRAQFAVLRRMNQFDPPLVVDRTGFRAVIKMQLMHKKTAREREWAQMKSHSWPPWKEEKLGIDADIGPEHGVSRAKEALQLAQEAGYAMKGWEQSASILAGWDTDGSPTIQTRHIFDLPLEHDDPGLDDLEANHEWASRIRATRTLNEGWALFQQCKSEVCKPSEIVYQAMLGKIIFEAKRSKSESSGRWTPPEILPGDGPETYPESAVGRETVYLRTKAPDVDEFVELTLAHGIRSRGPLLAMVLANKTSLESGFRTLVQSALPRKYKAAFLEEPSDSVHPHLRATALQRIPPYLFEAFVSFLTRFGSREIKLRKDDPFADISNFAMARTLRISPLLHAALLIQQYQPRSRRPWTYLLRALAHDNSLIGFVYGRNFLRSRDSDIVGRDINAWHIALRVLHWMGEAGVTPDMECFMQLCNCLERAIITAERLPYLSHNSAGRQDIFEMARAVLSKGPSVVKEILKDCVRTDAGEEMVPKPLLKEKATIEEEIQDEVEQSELKLRADKGDNGEDVESPNPNGDKNFLPPSCLLPRLIEVPRAAHLHQFIRVLGLMQDHGGLLDLIEWMALYAEEIQTQAEEQRSGARMFRRCLVATRVFLERSWNDFEIDYREHHVLLERNVEKASEEVLQSVKSVIQENPSWGGWPEDWEVQTYLENGRFL